MDKVLDKRAWIGAFPFRFKGGEAAFCRFVAFVQEVAGRRGGSQEGRIPRPQHQLLVLGAHRYPHGRAGALRRRRADGGAARARRPDRPDRRHPHPRPRGEGPRRPARRRTTSAPGSGATAGMPFPGFHPNALEYGSAEHRLDDAADRAEGRTHGGRQRAGAEEGFGILQAVPREDAHHGLTVERLSRGHLL